MTPTPAGDLRRRLRIEVEGDVQGVGFRPFAWHAASGLGIGGFVANTNGGVLIEAEGTAAGIEAFVKAMESGCPPPAVVRGMTVCELPPDGTAAFEIRSSIETAGARPSISPDLATCAACVAELFDPGNRRHRSHQAAGSGRAPGFPDQRAVELDLRERRRHQPVDVRGPDAEIVEREPEAMQSDAGQTGDGGGVGLQHGGLGHLDRHRAGV